ncbi:MAG: hypothetical protein KC422_16625 [Trueperaceae bacterium]|nr:hypothetical protein [Trueperaceae bacterium]
MNLDTIYLARERYKELIGEVPKVENELFKPNVRGSLATLFHGLANWLEPKQRKTPKRRLAKH